MCCHGSHDVSNMHGPATCVNQSGWRYSEFILLVETIHVRKIKARGCCMHACVFRVSRGCCMHACNHDSYCDSSNSENEAEEGEHVFIYLLKDTEHFNHALSAGCLHRKIDDQ